MVFGFSTMISGSGKGTITTQTADSGGKQYAGSVAGYNEGTILKCVFGGKVNGAEASEANVVGGGNAPTNSGGDPNPAGTFSVSETSIEFPGTGFTQTLLNVTTGEKAVCVSSQGLSWLKDGDDLSKD